jgi:glycosyltransferase involved in cell wall biosynthesis
LSESASTNARISVVIPIYDCAPYAAEAIESVLQQTLPPAEIILVDDGSTDSSFHIARSYETAQGPGPVVTVLQQPHAGIGAARNLGCRHATGNFLAFHDADDTWSLNKLELQMQRLLARPELDMVFTNVLQFYSPECDVPDLERAQMESRIFAVPIAASCLFRRVAYDRVGPFRVDVRVGEFVDWLGRARDAGLISEGLPEPLLQRRIHGTNTGLREREYRGGYARVLKDALDRRRQAAASPASPAHQPAGAAHE